MCQGDGIQHARPKCQRIPGNVVDEAIGNLLIESVTPLALEVALNVQDELKTRIEEADRLRKQMVERARYEADLARRRYMQVDPENRLVADALEADWNDKLRALTQSQEEYEKQRKVDRTVLDNEQRSRILSLATDFPQLWRDTKVGNREKKRMVRLLLEDVTLVRDRGISVHIRFKGGPVKSLSLPAPMSGGQLRKTSKEVVLQIDQLLEQHTDDEIARILNEHGKVSGTGKSFNAHIIGNIRRAYDLKTRFERLRTSGLLTLGELSKRTKLCEKTLKSWASKNIITSYKYNGKNERLYERPGNGLINKLAGGKHPGRSSKFIELVSNRINEVQYEV